MKHFFDTDIAAIFSIEAAILLANIEHWMIKNQANKKHYYQNRYWTYNTVHAWEELFPYMTHNVIRKRLDLLAEKGVLLKGNFNEDRRDRTIWYSIDFDRLQLAVETNAIVSQDKSSLYTDSKQVNSKQTASDDAVIEEYPLIGKREKEKVKKEKSPVFTACVKIWLEEIHPGWTFKGGMDGKALKGIIESMRHYSLNKNEREPTEEELINFFRHLCGKLPEFYKLQTLSVINSKFDPIVEQIKKGGNAQLRGNSQVSIFSKYRHV